ncbi:MAG: glutathione S-transferase [Cytophagales bacterium]|nr:glutathione S-transferase [Rhizobacter sp.]
MPGYTLYGSQGSGSSTVELALERIGLPYRLVRASTWESESALAELRALNPMGQIPTLQLPDGSVMTESAAILIHLGLSHPEAALLPTDVATRAQAIRGLVFIVANCYSNISISDYPERWISECAEDDPLRERVRLGARAQLHRAWEIFADSHTARPYFHGAAPGALDYLAAVVSKWSGTRAHLEKHRPAFFNTLQRIEQHPQVAPVFARHWPAA